MRAKWHIAYYSTENGSIPLKSFIDEQEVRVQVKIVRMLELLEEFGTQIGAPHVKKLTGTDLWELRILGNDSTRILYVAIRKQTFLLLHAFKKKTQKTDKKEIKLAQSRLDEYLSRK